MSENWFKSLCRELFRWYLRQFPLRDGKALMYARLHAALAPAARFATVRLNPGFRMKLDLADPEQLKVYFYGHYHERYEARLVQSLLAPGEVFWDIGANVGYFSLVATAAVGGGGLVVAFEPGQASFERLRDNLALNDCGNVSAYQLAVSDRAGEARLYRAEDIADTGASLYGPGPEAAPYEVCRTVALDDFCREQNLPFPAFIKMDVEGAELAALKGAAGVLAAAQPLLLLEMEDKTLTAAGASKGLIQDLLRPLGYQAAFLRKGRWRRTGDVDAATGRNIFWFNPDLPVHREKLRLVPVA
jgi:FkbM family methyltransferase